MAESDPYAQWASEPEPELEEEEPGLLTRAAQAVGLVDEPEPVEPVEDPEDPYAQYTQPSEQPYTDAAIEQAARPEVNPYAQIGQPQVVEEEPVGGVGSWFNNVLRGLGTTGTGIIQSIGLAQARSPGLLGYMDQYDIAKTDEERDDVNSTADLLYRPRARPPMAGGMSGSQDDWETWEAYREAEGDVEAQAQIRIKLMQEVGVAMENPIYQAGESFDEWVKESTPTVQQDPESWDQFWKEVVPQGVGSLGSFAVAGAVTRGAAGRIAPAMARTRAGSAALGIVGAGIPGSAVNYSGVFNDAIASGADVETAFKAAELGGYVGALEGVPIGFFLSRADKLTKGAVTTYFKDVAVQGIEEAAQEGLAELLNNLIAQNMYDPETQLWGTQATMAAGAGLTTGALLEAILGLTPGRRRAKAARGGAVDDDTENPAAIIERRMQEAERVALEAGADPLAAKNAAAAAGQEAAAELDEETGTEAADTAEQEAINEAVLVDIETDRALVAGAAALRRVQAQQKARKAIDEAPTPEEAEAAEGEQAVEEADRLSQQEQAAERYEAGAARVRAEPGFEEQEKAAAEEKRADITEMEVQRPPPEEPPGGGAPPASPAMGEAFKEAQRQKAAKRDAAVAKRVVPEDRRIEDRTADFDVTPEGEVQPRGQQPRVQPPAQEPGIERPYVKDEDQDLKFRIDEDAEEAATSPANDLPQPSQEQIDAGNYKKGHVSVQGLDISIENPKGSTRSSKPGARKQWSQKMKDHYGYLRRTEGADGEQIDVFIGENPTNDRVFVVDQVNQQTGDFDEHKAMIGYNNQADAKRGYLRNFEKGWKPGAITEMSMDEFKSWVKTNPPRRPASGVDMGSAYSPELAESVSGTLGPGGTQAPIPAPPAALARERARSIGEFDRLTDYLVYDRTRTDEEIAASLDQYDAEWADKPNPYEGMGGTELVAEMKRLTNLLGKSDPIFLTEEEQNEIKRGLSGRPDPDSLRYRLDEDSQGSLPGIPPVAPDFYSRMKETVNKKLPNRMGEQQLWEWQIARVKAGDFNQAEADFIDLAGEFMTGEGSSTVTKADILDYLDIRQPEILEMVLTTNVFPPREFTTPADTIEGIRSAFGPSATFNDGVFDTTYNNNQTYNIFDEHHVIIGAIKPTGGKRRDPADITAGTTAPDFTWTVSAELAEHLEPQYDEYQIFDADENYREILYQLPFSKAFMSKFVSGHWRSSPAHANTLAHARISDVQNAQGQPVLFVQELQSDWHQKARDARKAEVYRQTRTGGKTKAQAEADVPRDYAYTPARMRQIYDQKVALAEAGLPAFENWVSSVLNRNATEVVEDAPFKRDWPLMIMKRVINRAISEGHAEVAWPKGYDIAALYNMANEVGLVEFNADHEKAYVYATDGEALAEGYYDESSITDLLGASAADRLWDLAREELAYRDQYSVTEEADELGNFQITDPNGEPMFAWGGAALLVEDSTMILDTLRESMDMDQLPGWRSVAVDMVGEDVTVGGEGMVGFYDVELVNKVNKYLKKLGSKVVDTQLDIGENDGVSAWSFPITDKMRQVLSTRGQPMFRRGEEDVAAQPARKSKEEALVALDPLIKQIGGLKVEVVNTAADLPPNLFNKLQNDNATGVKGFFQQSTGTVYVLAENHRTTEDLERTLLHEGVAHAGLRALLPQNELNGILDQVWASSDLSARHKQYRHDKWADQTAAQRATAEEHIAHLAEVEPDNSFVKRVVAMVRNTLRQMGLGVKWTDDDIYMLLKDTRRALKRVELDTIEVTTAAQVIETGEIIDVEEGADVALRQMDKRIGVVESLRECLSS